MICLVGALGPCPTEGPEAPSFAVDERCEKLMQSAQEYRIRRGPLHDSSEWLLVRKCLRWSPIRRVQISHALQTDSWLNDCVDAAVRPMEPAVVAPQESGVCVDAAPNLGATCACRGRCRKHNHAVKGYCLSTALVDGGRYCIDCVCDVVGCFCPKDRSSWCCRHRRLVEGLPAHGQLAVAAASHAANLLPADVEDGK